MCYFSDWSTQPHYIVHKSKEQGIKERVSALIKKSKKYNKKPPDPHRPLHNDYGKTTARDSQREESTQEGGENLIM